VDFEQPEVCGGDDNYRPETKKLNTIGPALLSNINMLLN
jgi:hypothetical protein